ncbi:hypothetical protein [Dyadobacter sp. CY351]|uniref:hypothetical protein n=1 Tax=Dyadobacter sp. CY351 TaxID=2909337 RepID=UPI001F46D700|nr:hypothetical protein [Dyadobacter sp. CY351]MCF2517128.1 hypothetical protein [Dyadobacter sp. CY351]
MKVELGGVDGFNVTLEVFNKSLRSLIWKEVAGAALRTEALAKLRCQPNPEDNGDAELSADIAAVKQSINHTLDESTLTARVFAGNTAKDHCAAYLEFGTGDAAARYVKTLPFEFEALAWQFYVNGKGTMREHPFLVPTYLQEGKRFVEKLKGLKPRIQ